MRLGLVARADNSGLGVQTHEFYLHMKPAKTLVVDISDLNGNKTFPERYNNSEGTVTHVGGLPNRGTIDEFLEGLDVVFIAEAAYNPYLYERAREMGVKTAVQYNYEFMDWLVNDSQPVPDMFIAPSRWHFAEVNAWVNNYNLRTGRNVAHKYLHCPVNRDKLPARTIKQARTFLHVAGRSAALDRNGTKTVIEAAKYLTSQAQIVIHFQGEQGLAHQATMTTADYRQLVDKTTESVKEAGGHLTMVTQEFVNYSDVYAIGDVLLLPRRYGGNCLPLNEALSCGMPAIMTDISPNNGFLPHNWLIPALMVDQFSPRTTIDVYGAYPQDLAKKIDEFYNFNESQMWFENVRANNLGRSISWQSMKPEYEAVLEELCTLR